MVFGQVVDDLWGEPIDATATLGTQDHRSLAGFANQGFQQIPSNGIDDPVGAISVHGTVGIWGVLAVPITNDEASIGAQLLGIGSIFAWVFVTSFVVWFVLKKTLGIRVDEQQEYEGVDLSECGLEAYPEFTKAD